MASILAAHRFRALLLALGCALFVYLTAHFGVREVLKPLREIGWRFTLIAAIFFGYELARAFAYRECVAVSGQCSYWDLVRLRLSGEAIQFLTSTGPFLAEPAKMWLLQKRGLSAKHAVAATVCENLTYTFTSAVLAIAGLTHLLGHFQLSQAVTVAARVLLLVSGGFLAAAVFAVAGRIYLIGAILKGVRKIPHVGRHVKFADNDVRETEDMLFAVLRDRPLRLVAIMAAEFAAQALLVLELLVLLHATGESLSVLQPLMIEGATKFIGLTFFFIPGQVGAAEGSYALIFMAMQLPASAGFAVALARRLRSLLIAGLGLALTPGWRGGGQITKSPV